MSKGHNLDLDFAQSVGWFADAGPDDEHAWTSRKVETDKNATRKTFLEMTVHHRRLYLKAMTDGAPFNACIAILICLNALFLGMRLDDATLRSRAEDGVKESFVWSLLDFLLFACFVLEWLLRIYAHGRHFFTSCPEAPWHVFDTLCILVSIADFASDEVGGSSDGVSSLLRILRVCRVIRIFRFVRVLRYFREMRLLISGIIAASRTLMWTLVMGAILLYMFSIAIKQGIVQYRERHGDTDAELLRLLDEYFATVSMTMNTLFLSITGGIEWKQASDPVWRMHRGYGALLHVYVMLTLYGLYNLAVGVFVTVILHLSEKDRNLLAIDQMCKRDSHMSLLREILVESSGDSAHANSGAITWNDFERHLGDKRVRNYLELLDLDVSEARGLFRLMDMGDKGEVSINEFIFTCFNIKAQNGNVNLPTLMYEHKKMMTFLLRYMTSTEHELDKISKAICELTFPGLRGPRSRHLATVVYNNQDNNRE